jgi:hypothetical protein
VFYSKTDGKKCGVSTAGYIVINAKVCGFDEKERVHCRITK